jgi:hypothetical protein
MESSIVTGKIKEAVKDGGVCIYCGWDGGSERLRSEHIIPYSLGGNVELLSASCRECESRTVRLDDHLANAVFAQLRVHTNVQSRSGHKPTLSIEVEQASGRGVDNLATKDHPFFLNMPFWSVAGCRRGARLDTGFGPVHRYSWWSVPPNIQRSLVLKDGELARLIDTSRPLRIDLFARGLAKIAYCYGVRAYGLTGFRPLVTPDIILGKYPHLAFFIGSEPEPLLPPYSAGRQHSVSLGTLTYGRQRLLTATIRLFGDSGVPEHGTPLYHVIYGAEESRAAIPLRRVPRLPRVIIPSAWPSGDDPS